jgi:ferric-dicitrate binding protein FerR (iron transport regulator)
MKEKTSYKVKFLPITKLEKINLKNKIFNSIHKSKSRKRQMLYAIIGIAASLLLITAFNFLFSAKSNDSIIDFVNSLETTNNNASDEVTLILGEGENLKIDEKITSINYSDSGEEVTIGATKTVSQQTLKNNKLVYNTLIVPYGKRSKIQLSDGSIVWLNSGSRLVYPIVFKGEKREVHLEGEGIFEVAYNKNQPFIVISQNQEVEVLGTVFGITNYLDENSINTVLKSGSVQISYTNALSSNSDKMKITPGTIASYNKKSKAIISEKVNVDQYFSWRDGVLIFKNNDLKFIMKKLSRYYNIEIEISEFKYNKDNEGETFSGYLDLNEDLDKVIKNIQMSTNMKYRFIENKLIIN